MDATFIVLMSFVLFIGIAYRLGYRQSMAFLDQKITNIHQALNNAEEAKEAAIKALNEERRYQTEVIKEIELIAKRAEEQAITLKEQALQDIERLIVTRQKAAEGIIKRMHQAAIQTIQEEATEKALAAFEELATTNFSPSQHEALNESAIAQISTQLAKPGYGHKPKRLKSK